MMGDQQRACPTKFGNSNRWSGEPLRCIPKAAPGRLVGQEEKFCPGMFGSDRNVQVSCEDGSWANTLQERRTLSFENQHYLVTKYRHTVIC